MFNLLTSWPPPQNKFADFIVDKDKQAVWKSTEPPVHPKKRESRMERQSRESEGIGKREEGEKRR